MKTSLTSEPVIEAAHPRSAPLFTVRDLLLWLYLYPVRFFLKFLSRDSLYRIGRAAEPLLQFHYRNWRRAAATRMLVIPASGITADQAARIARQLISNSIYRLLDDIVAGRPGFLKEVRCNGVSGIEHLDSAKSAGKGVVVLTGHFYANRVARRYLAAAGYPMLVVRFYDPSEEHAGRVSGRFVRSRLMEFLHGVIQDEVYVQDPGCTLKILQRLRSGGLVSINMDAWRGARTVESHLLGVPRRFSGGLFDILRLSGCTVVPMLCLGKSSNLRIIFDPALAIVESSNRDEFVAANLPVFIRTLEKQIAAHPAEWTLWPNL